MLLPAICTTLYVLGGFLYYLHQLTILYLKEADNYSEGKVFFNAMIWPFRVVEIIVEFIIHSNRDEE